MSRDYDNDRAVEIRDAITAGAAELAGAIANLAHAVRNLPGGLAAAGFGGTTPPPAPGPDSLACLTELTELIDAGFPWNDTAIKRALKDARAVIEAAEKGGA